jgi:hypothetical protein
MAGADRARCEPTLATGAFLSRLDLGRDLRYKEPMKRNRRWLVKGIVSMLAAPAIVPASVLMPVKAWARKPDWVDLSGLRVDGAPTHVGGGWCPIDPLYLVDPLYVPACDAVYDVSPMLARPQRWGFITTLPLEQIRAPVLL